MDIDALKSRFGFGGKPLIWQQCFNGLMRDLIPRFNKLLEENDALADKVAKLETALSNKKEALVNEMAVNKDLSKKILHLQSDGRFEVIGFLDVERFKACPHIEHCFSVEQDDDSVTPVLIERTQW